MNNQPDLFSMARTSDLDTSHEAADQHAHKLSERRQQVLSLVKRYPGLTQGELSHLMLTTYKLPIATAAATPHKRLPELEKLGLVRRERARKCSDTGYKAATWMVSDAET